ncbi:MAG: thioesterase family protein [Armatimonadetes bacterium]|nr:thioesterase family protein [Anaerolineae bacterium]
MRPTPLSLDHITQTLFLLRATIPEAYRDENGHMNVRWYMSLYDDAGYPLIDTLGLTLAYHAQHGTGGFDLEHHLHYLNEVHVGDTVAVYARLVGRSAKRIHYLMFMVNETRHTLASIYECVNSFADLRTRKTAPYPPEIAVQIDSVLAQHEVLEWDAPICGIMGA